jgi:hypothetical protein
MKKMLGGYEVNDDKQDGSLNFNVDALTDGVTAKASLSDLYGIPVFSDKTNQSSAKIAEANKQQMKNLKNDVFYTNNSTQTKELKLIKAQVFSTKGLAKEDIPIRATSKITAVSVVISIALICFVIAGIVLYMRKKRKDREEYLETIDNFF